MVSSIVVGVTVVHDNMISGIVVSEVVVLHKLKGSWLINITQHLQVNVGGNLT